MGAPVFGNEFFDQWLNQKSNEILSKVEKEKISTEDMLILSLKAQVNHFHHMDIEFREEFRKVDQRFEQADARLVGLEVKMDRKFDLVDKRFDRHMQVMMWGFGLISTMTMTILFKLFS